MPPAVLEIVKAEFDGAVAEGGLFLLTMHPHIIGHRSRIALLAALIERIKRVDGVWFTTTRRPPATVRLRLTSKWPERMLRRAPNKEQLT